MAPLDQNNMKSKESNLNQHIRQYPSKHTGPFFVYKYKRNRPAFPLKSVTMAKYLYAKLKFVRLVQSITRVKIRTELLNANDANALVKDPFFEKYRIYIPAEDVEIQRIIKLSLDCDAAKCTEFGKVKVKHLDISNVPLLES